MGSNTSIHHHLWAHFDVYKKLCGDVGIPLHHYAFPQMTWDALEKKEKQKDKQQILDNVLTKSKAIKEFSRDTILHAVTQFVVCDNQVCPLKIRHGMVTQSGCRLSRWQARQHSKIAWW